MNKKEILLGVLVALALFLSIIWLVRLFLPRQLDDLSPEIPCSSNLIEKASVLCVIPKFNNKSINENQEWCSFILSLNKTLTLHGVYHNYNEFLENKDKAYLQEGINIFEECFGFKPENFKPPQLAISGENKKLVKSYMNLDLRFNQFFHKVYHCNDSGFLPNWLVDII